VEAEVTPRWPDLYRLIGANVDAGQDEIKAAFEAAYAEAATPSQQQAVLEAWSVLGEPQRRAAYDRQPFVDRAAPADGAELAEHLRPVVVWALTFVLAGVGVVALLRPIDPGSVLLLAYLAAGYGRGWSLLRRGREWLRLYGWWPVAGAVVLAPLVGAVVTPFDVLPHAVAAGRLLTPLIRAALARWMSAIRVALPWWAARRETR
jgi:hypothetical protein